MHKSGAAAKKTLFGRASRGWGLGTRVNEICEWRIEGADLPDSGPQPLTPLLQPLHFSLEKRFVGLDVAHQMAKMLSNIGDLASGLS